MIDNVGASMLHAGVIASNGVHHVVPHTAEALLDAEREASLTGRGGAAFPAWRKLASVLDARARPIIIATACEGEPWSHKDAELMRTSATLVWEALLALGEAVRASEIAIVASPRIIQAASGAFAAAPSAIRRYRTEDRFVAGESSAVASAVATGRAVPFDRSMPLAISGVRGRPTLVHNVETLAAIGLILRHGPVWFARRDPRLVSVTGDVPRPGVIEVRRGTSIEQMVVAAGIPSDAIASAGNALVGGVSGGWVPASSWRSTSLDAKRLSPWRASAGAGVVRVVGTGQCPLRTTARVLSWLAGQSSGQCGPCRIGLPALAEAFNEAVEAGLTAPRAQRIRHLIHMVDGRGICHHPDGAARLALNGLEQFENHWRAHRPSPQAFGTERQVSRCELA